MVEHQLKLHSYHYTEEKARKQVVGILESLGVTEPANGWYRGVINRPQDPKWVPLPVPNLVREMRLTGSVARLLPMLDQSDPIFGALLAFGSNDPSLHWTTNDNGFTKKASFLAPIHGALTSAILNSRVKACESSNQVILTETCSYFSSYLLLSVALVERFMGMYVVNAALNPSNRDRTDNFINSRNRFEDRLDIWLKMFTGRPLDDLRTRREWEDFQILRAERNKIVHGNEAYFGYLIADLVQHLNRVRLGVGGLLGLLREWCNQGSLSFIDQLKSAPLAYAPGLEKARKRRKA